MIDNWRYTFQLFFDADCEKTILRLIDQFRAEGFVDERFITDNYRPHVSLTVHRTMDELFARSIAQTIASQFSQFEVKFSHFGLFNGEAKVLYLGLTHSDTLRAIHQVVHQKFKNRSEVCWELYTPTNWVPHCAVLIGMDSNTILRGASRVIDTVFPHAFVSSIGVTGFDTVHEFTLH